MIPASTQSSAPVADRIDQRIRLHGIGWEDYVQLLAARGDQCGVRVTYLEGELELMNPSVDHESLKTRLGRLLEAYADELGIELEGFGSWTVRSQERERGVEADECYILGPIAEMPEIPDIAIEVVWTAGASTSWPSIAVWACPRSGFGRRDRCGSSFYRKTDTWQVREAGCSPTWTLR